MTTPTIETVSAAIENRVWLKTVYQSYDPDTGKTMLRKRGILPFRVYESKEGNYVIDGYDTYRDDVRTFRLDRFAEMELGDAHKGSDPNIIFTRGDFVVWPAAWPLLKARPQIVSEKSLPKFLEHGWSLTPCADVIVKPS